jgi:hypothetical protein
VIVVLFILDNGVLRVLRVNGLARSSRPSRPSRQLFSYSFAPYVVRNGLAAADLVDLIDRWIPDAALRRKILVDNPASLYRF